MYKLKTFESFDLPYREILVGQASDAFQSRGGWDKLTPSEAGQISDLIKKIDGKEFEHKGGSTLSYLHPRTGECVVVNKGKDEYYYVMDDSTVPGTWYECDGLEGLIKCLSDI